ncbi:Zinc carboxypeptidase A 1 [Pseudolycoriella hygida]|uniref:Zinc carboxypeptidase A 1 n=1 Tax=Pseudolycoriella hygida TaxID=35572 RepID=A0A9Q0NGN6_9DIPT|nr:Zinc carboxypeptidase A 1 [Pseudolycoriella hygida]
MGILKGILAIIFFASVVWSRQLTFHDFKVFSVKVENEEQLRILKTLENDDDGFSYWKDPILGRDADIVVSPNKLNDFNDLVSALKLNSTMKIANIQKLIDAESPLRQSREAFGWENYHTLDEINAWLDGLLISYPDILSVHHVGYSYQNREIRAIKLSHKNNSAAILIEANIHAREWISSATATWLLNELLTSTDPEVVDIATNINWYFIPVLNPDGFVYTKTTNRLWRKSRYPHQHLCYGVDLNRNFDFMWMHVGASSNPCSDTFAGPTPFSDPETKALSEFMTAHIDEIKVFITFHSYGQFILTPFAYTYEPADNYEQLKQVGNAGADAIRQRYGTNYVVGSSAEVLYMNSGSSRDWIKGIHNINISFTIELRDQGSYGFILPPEQIIPNCLEIFDGLKAIVSECKIIGYL